MCCQDSPSAWWPGSMAGMLPLCLSRFSPPLPQLLLYLVSIALLAAAHCSKNTGDSQQLVLPDKHSIRNSTIELKYKSLGPAESYAYKVIYVQVSFICSLMNIWLKNLYISMFSDLVKKIPSQKYRLTLQDSNLNWSLH